MSRNDAQSPKGTGGASLCDIPKHGWEGEYLPNRVIYRLTVCFNTPKIDNRGVSDEGALARQREFKNELSFNLRISRMIRCIQCLDLTASELFYRKIQGSASLPIRIKGSFEPPHE